MLAISRKFNGTYSLGECGPCINKDQIKAELAQREHIPNKREARPARQRIAKEKRNR